MEQTPGHQNKKTVLLVDADPANLRFISGILVDRYDVITARSSKEAIRKSKSFKKEIDLLLSDLQMTGISGIDLATSITNQRPDIKVLPMSRFTGGMLVLNEGWHFLPQPFIPSQLRALVVGLIPPTDAKSRFKVA